MRLADLKPHHEDIARGDADAGLRDAALRVEARYATPVQHHNPIELFTTRAAWDGDRLTVHEPTRYVGAVRHGLAAQLGLDPARVRVVAGLIGGHFGSKFALSQHTALVALAARRLGRPVSLVPSRRQCFTIANYRPESRHRIRLGADRTGRFTALVHEAETVTSRFDPFVMEGAEVTASLYACPNIRTEERAVRVDRNTPGPMRAPPEVPFLFALESAVDEMAVALDMDPIALRRLNDTAVDPVSGKPFSTRPLMACFEAGARAFGWSRRVPRPGSMRDGPWRVGLGCATSVRPAKIAAATMRVRLGPDGSAEVSCAHHEIGTGITTLLALGAADGLGVPVERVTVRLGDTDLPAAGISGGSSTTTSLMSALALGCGQIREALAQAATGQGAPRRPRSRCFAPRGRTALRPRTGPGSRSPTRSGPRVSRPSRNSCPRAATGRRRWRACGRAISGSAWAGRGKPYPGPSGRSSRRSMSMPRPGRSGWPGSPAPSRRGGSSTRSPPGASSWAG
ncbi:xanthine dehydrogenase family protein molybdopterin-binding subunit [Methylobacterium oryzae CBMB20]